MYLEKRKEILFLLPLLSLLLAHGLFLPRASALVQPSRQPARPTPLPFLGRPSLGQATAAAAPAQLAPQLPRATAAAIPAPRVSATPDLPPRARLAQPPPNCARSPRDVGASPRSLASF